MQDIRKSPEYQRWRREVRQRDGDACRVCGVHLNLHIHHIKPLEKYPDFATEIDNGITLCGNCHALLKGKEESTNLQTIIEATTKKPDMRTADQLRKLSGKFYTYLEPRIKSIHSNLRNEAIRQLFVQLQIYPDSLDQFLPLIRYLLDRENSRFNPGFIVQMAVEYLKGSSSSAALKVLREHEERIEAEAKEQSELFPSARQSDDEAQFCLDGESNQRQVSARDHRELAIMQSNESHPLNKAAADQLAKMGGLPPSCLYALVLIQHGIDETMKTADQTPSWLEVVEEQMYEMETWMPKRTMRYLTHWLEDDEPTEAATLVRRAENPLDAAQELIEIVRQNIVVSGVEIAEAPWL